MVVPGELVLERGLQSVGEEPSSTTKKR